MIESAERVILVMDSSKMNKSTFCRVSGLDVIDLLISDAGLSADDRKRLEDRGISVELCSVEADEQSAAHRP